MKPSKELPPLDFLQECFTYQPETGKLFWKQRPLSHFENEREFKRFNSRWPGKQAGGESYQTSTGKPMKTSFAMVYQGQKRGITVHRVVLALHGIRPAQGLVIDHIDGNAFNNRLENLRVLTHAQNIANNGGYRNGDRTPRALPRGVYFVNNAKEKKYRSYIKDGPKSRLLGYFLTSQEASEAFEKAHKELYGY